MKRLSVLFVINGLGTGGAERSLAEMLPGLADEGIDAVVACLYRRERGVERSVVDEHADVRFIAARNLPGRVRALRRVVRSVSPDIVHTTIFEASIAARLACVGLDTVVLTSLVNTQYAQERLQDPALDRKRIALVRRIDGWTARHLTQHFHAITEAVADHAVSSLGIPRERITVIERGRDASRLGSRTRERRLAVRAALGLPPDAEVVVNLGRRDFQKGQQFLIEAVSMLAERRPRLVTVIAGRDGARSDALRVLSQQKGIEERVVFLGHRDDAPDIIAAADLFAFPSLFEGLGGSLIEAMALGLPIVASDIPAIREVVEAGGNATLVPPASSTDLAAAIENLLVDKAKAASFGRRGREIFAARFTLERSTGRMIGLYRGLAGVGDVVASATVGLGQGLRERGDA